MFIENVREKMQEELTLVSNTDKDNLSHLARTESDACELGLFVLSDIRDEVMSVIEPLYRSGLGVYDLFSYIEGAVSICRANVLDKDTAFPSLVSAQLSVRSSLDKGAFCKLLADGLEKLGIGESDFLPTEDRIGSFTYVKNTFADEAYDVLSSDYEDARVKYSRDFAECARLLYNRDVSYVLLPFEEKGGTRLPSVAELIYRNDFKVVAVTPVFGPDGTADLKYALLSNSFTVPEISSLDDRYLEIRLSDGKNELASLLSVAVMLGHTIYRVNTHSFIAKEDKESFFSVVIRDEGRSFLPLLTYLTMFVTDYVPQGIYKNLE